MPRGQVVPIQMWGVFIYACIFGTRCRLASSCPVTFALLYSMDMVRSSLNNILMAID